MSILSSFIQKEMNNINLKSPPNEKTKNEVLNTEKIHKRLRFGHSIRKENWC